MVTDKHFNPRSREGSDLRHRLHSWMYLQFQSTLPRRERLAGLPILKIQYHISIHAPAKGATEICLHPHCIEKFQSTLPRRERPATRTLMLPGLRFQSTLPRRERLNAAALIRMICNFNPRSREGSDGGYDMSDSYWNISIHAPAKGATRCYINVTYNYYNFNPRSREGSDGDEKYYLFSQVDFNPRSREGSDDGTKSPLYKLK